MGVVGVPLASFRLALGTLQLSFNAIGGFLYAPLGWPWLPSRYQSASYGAPVARFGTLLADFGCTWAPWAFSGRSTFVYCLQCLSTKSSPRLLEHATEATGAAGATGTSAVATGTVTATWSPPPTHAGARMTVVAQTPRNYAQLCIDWGVHVYLDLLEFEHPSFSRQAHCLDQCHCNTIGIVVQYPPYRLQNIEFTC